MRSERWFGGATVRPRDARRGPKGGPGMPEMTHLTASIVGAGLAEDVALITDGRFGGGTQGISVGHVSPEAAAGGPLAILQDGDVVEIDAEANRLHVDLPDEEIASRLARVEHPAPRYTTGVLAKYARLVGPANQPRILCYRRFPFGLPKNRSPCRTKDRARRPKDRYRTSRAKNRSRRRETIGRAADGCNRGEHHQ